MIAMKTQEEFEREIYDIVKDEYTVLGSYRGSKKKVMMKHNICGNEYDIAPYNFKKGNRCRKCVDKQKGKKRRRTHQQFLKQFYALGNDEYEILSEYSGAKSKVKVKHTLCGSEYYTRCDVLLRGSKCKNCLNKRISMENTKSTDDYSNEVYTSTQGEYTLVSEYVNVNTKVKVRHKECNYEYEVFPYLFQRGRRCPKCNSSKGEKIVSYVLNDIEKEYVTQYEFIDLKDVKKLSYDFYLPNENMLIEYQGIHHYKPIDFFGGEKQFNTQKRHDELKREYAKDRGIKLVEIPYTEDTYKKIKDYLSKYII